MTMPDRPHRLDTALSRLDTTLSRLDPGGFALVMATSIVSTVAGYRGHRTLSAVLLLLALGAFGVLVVAHLLRLARCPAAVRADLGAPGRAFAFFTFVAASDLLGVRLADDGHRAAGLVLVTAGALVWVVLSYSVPARLVLGPRAGVSLLAGVNGSWFLWVVGTQSLAVAVPVTFAGGLARVADLAAVVLWSAGIVLYLIVATLVLLRLLLLDVGPGDLSASYVVAMGATAISVFAATVLLRLRDSPIVTAVHPAVVGLAVVLWGFGTWLVPLLVAFVVRLGRLAPTPRAYSSSLWSAVFPLGMYAAASLDLGHAVRLPAVVEVGVVAAWVAYGAWAGTFAAMLLTVAGHRRRRVP